MNPQRGTGGFCVGDLSVAASAQEHHAEWLTSKVRENAGFKNEMWRERVGRNAHPAIVTSSLPALLQLSVEGPISTGALVRTHKERRLVEFGFSLLIRYQFTSTDRTLHPTTVNWCWRPLPRTGKRVSRNGPSRGRQSNPGTPPGN